MKIFGYIKNDEHIVTCNCGAVLKYTDKDIISEPVSEVDYWGVDRWIEHSIVCKKCKRKIRLRRL